MQTPKRGYESWGQSRQAPELRSWFCLQEVQMELEVHVRQEGLQAGVRRVT